MHYFLCENGHLDLLNTCRFCFNIWATAATDLHLWTYCKTKVYNSRAWHVLLFAHCLFCIRREGHFAYLTYPLLWSMYAWAHWAHGHTACRSPAMGSDVTTRALPSFLSPLPLPQLILAGHTCLCLLSPNGWGIIGWERRRTRGGGGGWGGEVMWHHSSC